ncbi:HEPN domain-containing protein [Streptomyces sp. NPDC002952]|uniref:ApeA N-terminal domain 1-containing protein n=1 Tax=Streptomyces sp. NPDC002952 TaxID=3364673 RepID=UPI0036A77BE2
MDKELEALLTGTVGFFYPISAEGAFNVEPERGFVSKLDSGRLEIRTLNEDPDSALFASSDREKPEAVICQFPEGSAAILNITRHGGTANIGGRKASVYNYSARTVITRFPVEQLNKQRVDIRVRELTAHFPGVSQWAGLKISNLEHERKPDGRSASAILRLQSPQVVTANLGSLSLAIGGHWEVDNSDDRTSIYSPVAIGVKAKRARDISDLLKILVRIQDLINVAYDMFVQVDGGLAVTGAEPNPKQYPRFWNDALMEAPPSRIAAKSKRGLPLFTLADLNGADGVSRWVRLYDRFPSAYDAVATPYRHGGMTWHSYMRETAVGIERLIAASKRQGRPNWTRVSPHSYALAKRVGKPFAEFVGDDKAWADLFWSAYNGGKHQANYDPDPRDLSTLAISGNLLLTAYLLQRCGMSKAALDRLFQRGVSYRLRDKIRDLVANPPASLRPPSSR